MRLLSGQIPVAQPNIPFYFCLSPAEKPAMSQPVSAWTKWVTFTQLIQRISEEEEDGEIIVQRLSAVYAELTDQGRQPLSVDVFSKWLSRLTSDGPEITDQIYYVLDREGSGAMKAVEFLLGILCIFMKIRLRAGTPSALVRARRQLIFMYLDIQSRGTLTESDFLRILEMEAELGRKDTRLPSVSYGLKSCIDGAAVCISAAADSEFRVHEAPHQATIVRNVWDYVRNLGGALNYDTFSEAFDMGIIPEPVHMLRWELNIKRALGLTPKPQSLSAQPLADIRNALVTIVDDGIKVASVWLKNTATRVHTRVAEETAVHEVPITSGQSSCHPVSEAVSEDQVEGENERVVHNVLVRPPDDNQKIVCAETMPEKEEHNEAPPMCLAVTTATEDSSCPFTRDAFPSDCQRVDSTLSASIDLESELAEGVSNSMAGNEQTIPTEASADESIPEEGEVQKFSASSGPVKHHMKLEYLRKYLFPLLRFSTSSELFRVLPNKAELLEDFLQLLNAVVETFAAEDFMLKVAPDVERCVVIGPTEGSLARSCTLLQTAILSFQTTSLTFSSTLIPEGSCVIHAGNFLCDHARDQDKSETMYTLMALLSLKLAYPSRFLLLRGHNEGAENNAFQSACIEMFGSVQGIEIWNKVLDLAEYASYGVEVGRNGYVFGGALTDSVEKYLPHFNRIAKPLHFVTTGGKTKVWHAPEGSRHWATHDYKLSEIEEAMIESLCLEESASTVSAAVKLRTLKNTRWIVQQQRIGTTISLRWNRYFVLEAFKSSEDWDLRTWRDGAWVPITLHDPLCSARGEVKASNSLSDTIAQCEVHLKTGHVLTKMSSV